MNRTSVAVGVLAFLCCTALYAADWEGTKELSKTIKTNDLCEATATPPGKVVSGGQVLGCDWSWTMKTPLNYASWKSYYPEEPARQHGVRFEGEYIPEGEGGGGTPRIYDWGLTVTDPNKTCDYCLFSEIPSQIRCPEPTLGSIHDVPCSYIPNGNPIFRIMLFNIFLKEGDAPGVEAMEGTPLGYYLGKYPEINDVVGNSELLPLDLKPCEKCHVGTVHSYDISFPPLEVTSWVSEIFIATWKEMPTNARPQTCTAMTNRYDLILEHETKYYDQFKEYYAKPLMNSIDNLNASYHYEYCSLAFDLFDVLIAQDRALKRCS